MQPKQEDSDDLLEEQRLEESLEQLKELHLKLRALRTTIPRMVAPMSATYPSPDAFMSAFKISLAGARKEVSELKVAVTSAESKKLVDDADVSRQANPKGIRPWRATEDPNWTTPRTKKKT